MLVSLPRPDMIAMGKRLFGALVGLIGVLVAASVLAANPILSVTRSGSGSGALTSDVGAVDCGATCVASYTAGTVVTLTASPDGSSVFTGWLGGCTGAGVCQITMNSDKTAIATFAPAALREFSLDIDGTTKCDALTDGLLIIRYLFGLTGSALIANAVGPAPTRSTVAQIGNYLTDLRPLFDIDGDGNVDALTDGLLIIRYQFGLRGNNLIANAVSAGATRNTVAAIEGRIRTLNCAINQPPVVSAGSGQSIALPGPAALNGSATDDGVPAVPGALTYAWSQVSGPTPALVANPSQAATSVSFSQPGTYVLRLTAFDGALSASADVTITVNPSSGSNQPPVVNAGANQTIMLPAAATLNGSATDDGLPNPPGALMTTWSLVSGPASGVVFGNASALSTFATFAAPGTYVLRLTGFDGALSASSTLQVTVSDGPPQLAAVADRTIELGNRLQIVLEARDGNVNDVLTYALVVAPAGTTLNPAPLVDWTPTAAQLGTHTFTARVTDTAGNGATTTFHVTVVHTNHPPQLQPQNNQIVSIGTSFTRKLTATDPDAGDTLTFALVAGPAGMTLTGADLNWPTTGKSPGDYAVTVKVSDAGGLSDQKQFTVTLQTSAGPVAVDDAYKVKIGQVLTVPAPGVLANDGPAGQPLTATKLTNPDKGTLTAFGGDGSFTYQAPDTVVRPGVNPTTMWRQVASFWGFAQVIDHNRDGFPDIVIDNFGTLQSIDGRTGAYQWIFDASDTTNASVEGCQLSVNNTFAMGDVDGNGDITIVRPAQCGGFSDHYFAINASQVTNGKVRARWVSPRFSKPHPNAHTNPNDPAPAVPPIPPFFDATYNSEPTLARLTPNGGVKILSRQLIGSNQGIYYPGGGGFAYAACRSVTALPVDEGRACRATFIVDATTGVLEAVMTAPNSSDEIEIRSRWPWRQNAPIVADLDGDGQVEIISGSDVFKLVNGVWTFAWQSRLEPNTVAVADLDGDGKAEVIQYQSNFGAGRAFDGSDSGVFIYKHDGTLLRRIPLAPTTSPEGWLTVGDIDGDGVPEILVVNGGYLYAYHADGRLVWAYAVPDIPTELAGNIPAPVATFYRTGLTAAQVYDLDLDGKPEVILNASARLIILDGATGVEKFSIDHEGGGLGNGTLALADFDNDGHIDIGVIGHTRWNCSSTTGGPVPCLGNIMVLKGENHWAPGPKVFNQVQYRPASVNDAGRILYDGTTRRDFKVPAQQGTVTDPRLRDGTTFTYTASAHGLTSPPATVAIAIEPPNRPPLITSVPPTGALSLTPYPRLVYQITAVDPDVGDTIRYELVTTTNPYGTGPGAGVNLDPVTGAMDFYVGPCGSYGGPCDIRFNVVVAAIDSFGARAEQSFIVNIGYIAATVPNVVGQLRPAAFDAIFTANLTPRLLQEVFALQPAGIVLAQFPLAGTPNIGVGTAIDLTVSKGPQPVLMPFVVGTQLSAANTLLNGLGLSANVTTVFSQTIPAGEVMTQSPPYGTLLLPASAPPVILTVSAGGSLPAPIASIVLEPGPGPFLRLVSNTLQFKAVAVLTDGTIADITLSAGWNSTTPAAASVGVTGLARAIAVGTTNISATLGGKTAQVTLNVASRVGDNTPPVALITSPADGTSVNGPVAIIGTASDANFLRYELAIALASDGTFTVIAEGTTAVTNGTLGTLDPTTLLNDLYTVRLRAFDRADNVTIATTMVQVTGQRKVGLFSLTFVDLDIPMTGIPITVTRTYDSRDKAKGDFGAGWRLGLQTLRLRSNRVPGTGWSRTVSGPTVSLVPTSEHKVSITLGDGKVEEFDMIVAPTSNFGSLDATHVTGYTARPGTLGKLQALGNPDLLIVSGGSEVELVDDSTFNTYNPVQFRYTTAGGTVIDVHRVDGVQKMTDTNGNSLTFGSGGIIHSAGKSVVFLRDSQGRISQITDPMGNAHSYAYDANGDLVSHVDAVGGTSRFAYDRNHGLVDIRDPAGNRAVRNDYDAVGRLISTTDANGNVVTYTHDPGASREIVRDRLGNQTVIDYDATGNLLARTDALGHTRTYTYDNRDNQLTETDPLGRVSTRTYDAQNNVLTSTDFEGNTTTRTYNTRGQVLTSVDQEGRTTNFTYDASANLTQTTDPEGGVTRHTYNAAGNRLSTTDPLGSVTTFTFDAAGNRTSITSALGTITTSAYDASNRLISETDPAGRTLYRSFDAAGRLIGVTDRTGSVSAIAYSSIGDGKKVASRTDASGRIIRFDYDALGKLIKTTHPDGTNDSITYDAEGRTLSTTDRAGNKTSYQYDAVGRQIRITHADGTTNRTTYDASGRALTQTDERNNTRTIAYAANQQTITDSLGKITVHRFDSQGNRIRTTDALGHITNFAYDSKAQLTRTTFADATFKSTTYDAANRKTAETDQAGRSTQYAYDAAGQLLKVTDAMSAITTFTYDALGNRLTQTDANGQTIQMTYDAVGRLLSRGRPSGKQESFVYDVTGNTLSRTDFNGRTTTFVYDAMNRLVRKNLPGGDAVAYAYDALGKRVLAGGDTYTYDVRSRLIREQKAAGHALVYTRDAAGNITSVVTPQATTTYTFDSLNRMATVTDNAGKTTYGYDAVGNLATLAYPNAVLATYSYDALNRLVQLQNTAPGGLLSSYAYLLGPTGNRVQVVESGSATAGRTVTYTFDAVYRLTREQIAEPGVSIATIDYTYDAIGNRTRMDRDGQATNYTYDSRGRLVTEAGVGGTITSTWDDNGNLLTRGTGGGTDAYFYDAQDRLINVRNAVGTAGFGYDADGIRISKTTGGMTTTYLVDKSLPAAQCGHCQSNPGALAQVLAETTGSDTVTYTYGHTLLNRTQAGYGTHFYVRDGQLSTRQLANTAGIATDRYTFDAFGVTLAKSGATPNTYLYTGQQLDTNLAMYYLRARYYQQTTGRFISTDPEAGSIFEPASLHRYSYAGSDPVNNSDPTGRDISLISLSLTQAVQASLGIGLIAGIGARATGYAKNWSEALEVGAIATSLSLAVLVPYSLTIGQTIATQLSVAGSGIAANFADISMINAIHALRLAYIGTTAAVEATLITSAESFIGGFIQRFFIYQAGRCIFIESLPVVLEGLIVFGKFGLQATGTYPRENVTGLGEAAAIADKVNLILPGLRNSFGCP